MKLDQVLYQNNTTPTSLPVCDHYAGNEKFILKAFALQREVGPLFDVTCDLEDGARTGDEEAHAHLVADMLLSDQNPFQMAGVRIHDYRHPHWQKDIEIVLRKAGRVASHVTIPKVEQLSELSEMVQLIDSICCDAQPRIHVLIETHSGLEQVFQIAAHPRVKSLEFGLMDFISAHSGAIPASCMESPGQFENQLVIRAKTLISAAAAAHGKIASHNVTTAFSHTERVQQDACRAHQEFGFLRMWSIHPSQVQPIIRALSPNEAEISFAVRLLTSAEKAKWGPMSFENRLHDRASFRYYWEVLKRAQSTGKNLPEGTQQWFTD